MNGQESNLSGREQRLQEVLVACIEAAEAGRAVDRDGVLARYAEFAAELSEFFAGRAGIERLAEPLRGLAPALGGQEAALAQAPTLAPGEAAPAAGTRVGYFGDYELLEEIGRGGMGVVYKARQKGPDRLVALKMVQAGRWLSEADVQRFRNEGELVARLDHPHLVPIYELGKRPAGDVGPPVL